MSIISRTIAASDLAPSGRTVRLEADEGECGALARQYGLEAVNAFEADLTALPWRADGVAITGRVHAEIVQLCGVTLAPLDQTVEESFELHFLPAARLGTGSAQSVFSLADEDPPEPLDGDSIDLGAIAEEQFALAIDPYPRAPGAELPPVEQEDEGQTESPFAALARLKADKKAER